MKTKDFKSGTKMTKSTSVVPKAEQWGRVYDRGKKHFKGFCIQEEISRIKESGQRTVYKWKVSGKNARKFYEKNFKESMYMDKLESMVEI